MLRLATGKLPARQFGQSYMLCVGLSNSSRSAFDLCADDRIPDEYDTVLHRPELRIVPEEAAMVLELIGSAVQVAPALPLPVQLPDPTDLPFLEVATAAQAVLVTGNVRHFPKPACREAAVLRPSEFLDLLRHAP